jgi:hypothetical protein
MRLPFFVAYRPAKINNWFTDTIVDMDERDGVNRDGTGRKDK